MRNAGFRRLAVGLLLGGWLLWTGCSGGMSKSSSWNPTQWSGSKKASSGRLPGDTIPPARDVGLAAEQ